MTTKNTYGKNERLKSRKLIGKLFSSGKATAAFPVKVLYQFEEEAEVALQAGVTVSSRNFRKAVQRNRVKRILREAYRLNKGPLVEILEQSGKKMIVFVIYTAKELPDFLEVNKKMQSIFNRLVEEVFLKEKTN